MLLWLFLFSVLGSIALPEAAAAECHKSPKKPYELLVDLEHHTAEVKKPKRYALEYELSLCVHMKFDVVDYAFVKIPTTLGDLNFTAYLEGMFVNTVGFATRQEIPAKTWLHLCFTSTDGNTTYYLNGKIKESLDIEFRQLWWTVGRGLKKITLEELPDDDPDDQYGFRISRIYLFDKVLTPEEVKAVSCFGKATPKDLIDWNNLEWCHVKPQNTTDTKPPPACKK